MKTYYPSIDVHLRYAEMATIETPYHGSDHTITKQFARCRICKHMKPCIATENSGKKLIYYCDTCYARELARSVPPKKFSRPKRKFYVKQGLCR